MKNYKSLCLKMKEDYMSISKEGILEIELDDAIIIQVYIYRLPDLSEEEIAHIFNGYGKQNPVCYVRSNNGVCKSCFYEELGREISRIDEIFSNDFHNAVIRHRSTKEILGVFVMKKEGETGFSIWNVCRINSLNKAKQIVQKSIATVINSDHYKCFDFGLQVHVTNKAFDKYKNINFVETSRNNDFIIMSLDRNLTK